MLPDAARAKLTEAGLNLIQQALSIYDSELKLAVCNRRFQEMFDLPERFVTPGSDFGDLIRYLVERGEYGAAYKQYLKLAKDGAPTLNTACPTWN